MKKKRLLIILSVFVFISILIILSSEVFSLAKVEINYLTTTSNIVQTDEDILEAANFPYGANVFMLSKGEYVEKIEEINPYIKVVNIETVFPNLLRVHIRERNEVFAIKYGNNRHLICDEELKILRVSDAYSNTNDNAILLTGITIDEADLSAGDFLTVATQQNNLIKTVYKSIKQWNTSLVFLRANIEEVVANSEAIDNVTLKMRTGVEIIVYDVTEFAGQKFNLAFSVYEASPENKTSGKISVMKVEKPDGSWEIRAFK